MQLLYQTPHFDQVKQKDSISYIFSGAWRKNSENKAAMFDDHVELLVTAIDAQYRANVELNFVSPDRQIEFPPIEGAITNPVVPAFFEYDARRMSQITGGGEMYFRSRIRHAMLLADSPKDVRIVYQGKPAIARMIEIHPFEHAPLKDRMDAVFHGKTYRIWLSDEVPGHIAMIQSIAGDPNDESRGPYDQLTLRLDGVDLPN